MMASGFMAVITSATGHQMSRVSYHPELAEARMMEWVQKNLDWCAKNNQTMTYEITQVTGKAIGQQA